MPQEEVRSEEAFTTKQFFNEHAKQRLSKDLYQAEEQSQNRTKKSRRLLFSALLRSLGQTAGQSSLYLLKLGQGVQSAALGFGSSFSTFGIARPFSIYCRASAVRPICA